jgi:hypothetical protein
MAMNVQLLGFLIGFGCCLGALAQTSSPLTARELFYRDDGAAKPAVTKSGTSKQGKQTGSKQTEPDKVAAKKPEVADASEGTPAMRPDAPRPGKVSIVNAGVHLGVRYNVLLVTDRVKKSRRTVDPDSAFRAGDCVSIELMPNRDGFLYVFNAGSTGAWQALLPSPQMQDQRNTVQRGVTTVIPSEHCFEFDNTAGTERLLVVITEREEDQKRLSDAIRGRAEGGQPTVRPPNSGELLAGGGRLMRDLEAMRAGQLIGRDIKIAKIGASKAESEPPHSVYAVRAAAAPNERLVIEIALRHE